MIVRIITVHVKPEMADRFEEATKANHEGSLGEPGILRFDVLKDNADAGTYYLYEVYADEAATASHKETEHYKTWKVAVEPMMAGPRGSISSTSLFPKDPQSW